ncbi:uncharacterized protein LOC126586198 [Malus sylvestris]|uniref:uncharacterized protein LOC126586198 n=1 Tax=Malus sylvestris TaxID=3752 RepID=UPI0021AD4099|nr:uncharacterized protein LOC126586198 [Malus sylvestris]
MDGGGGEVGELQDWEVLNSSDPTLVNSDDSIDSPRSFEGIDVQAEGMIRPDYFSLDNQGRFGYGKAVIDAGEEGSVESDNPSWIDPGSMTQYGGKESGGFWSDSASDRSDDRKSHDFEGKKELGFVESEKGHVGCGGAGEMGAVDEKVSGLDAQGRVSVEAIGENGSLDKDLGKFWSDSGGDSLVSVKFEKVAKESEIGFSGLESGNNLDKEPEGQSVESQSSAVEEEKSEPKSGEEVGKRTILWWKVPFEVLKYCVFRVSPVWSLSVAAAVMGLVLLGRRLHKMKRKSQSLQLKVTLDDKKVSQFMSRAVRLNEAFSVVKRVPIMRPSLPAAGINPWPVMGLR